MKDKEREDVSAEQPQIGLSPIPEVPSELASEVSSMYSYAPDDDEAESEADTEVEGTKTPGSIMYSGSCSSVKSNGTLEDKAQAVGSSSGAESSDEDEDTEEEETDDEGDKVIIEAKPVEVYQDSVFVEADTKGDEGIDESLDNGEDEEDEEDSEEEESESSEDSDEEDTGNHYNSCVTAVTHQTRAIRTFEEQKEDNIESESMLAIVPSASSSNLDPSPGAICATEIFQHLQATRGKEEVTTELAKLLNVLQTTLKEDSSSSSESETSDESKEATPEPLKTPPKPPPLGKPPVHPLSLKGINQRTVGPEIHRKIKELASLKPGRGGKEEMSILSKILVTLLCSCKSAEATSELRKIIRHFKEAANEASDEVDEEIRPIKSRSSGRTASRGSKRRQRSRSRRSSANSNNSNSEAESLTNTLTPCNTDSKSSGTEDECPASVPPQRCSGCHTPTNDSSKDPEETIKEPVQADVSFTVNLPRRPSIEVAEITASISPTKMLQQNSNHEENEEDDEEEWEWEEDDDAASGRSRRSGKRVDSISSRDLSSAELKQDHSTTSSTRKILTEMECGAYNSDSLCSPGHNSGQSDGVSMSEQSHESPALDEESDLEEEEEEEDDEEEESEEEENLYSHLEETYRVLNGAYQIITGAHTETIVKEEVSSTIKTVQEEVASTVIQEETTCAPKPLRMLSRPSSKMSRPSSRRSRAHSENGTEEEDWGDDEEGDWEWEYYYEEEDGEELVQPNQVKNSQEKSPEKNLEKPTEIPVIVEPPPVAHQRYISLRFLLMKACYQPFYFRVQELKAENQASRPVSRQRKLSASRPGSRTGSRTGSRPSSRTSRKDGHLGGLQEEDDWEWEYYYEEDEEELEDELDRLSSPTPTTAPTTRATSPFPDQQQALKKLLKHAEQHNEPAWQLESTTGRFIGLPSYARAFETFHNDPDWYNPTNDLSVALAAQYLGQRSEEVAKALPSDFAHSTCGDKSEKGSSNAKSKKKSKHASKGSGDDTNSKDSEEKKSKKRRKKKKKKDEKFLPKITVRDLVNMLEPQLFKDSDTGTQMVMKEEVAKSSIAKQKKERVHQHHEKPQTFEQQQSIPQSNSPMQQQQPTVPSPPQPPPQPATEEPIKKEVVIIHDPKNPNLVEVCMDGQSTFVTMRPHSRRSTGAKSKDSKKGRKSGISKDKPNSPSDSEAYGTGSSVSEAIDNANYHGDDPSREDQPSRHSRLLRILQESEESEGFAASSDHESLASLPHTGGVAIERKLSFRSIKSSGRESDGDSLSGELLAKASPPVMRRQNPPANQQQRLMNLNLQSCLALDPITPSSSELSTPSSPGYLDYSQYGSLERRKRMSAPTTPSFRMWGTLEEEAEAKEVEDIMRRKVSSSMASPLARTLQESRLLGMIIN